MKNLRKLLGITLSAAMLTGVLAGCTTSEKPGENSPTPTPTAQGATPLVATEDVVEKLTGIPGETPLFTVDGEPVTAEQFFYWVGVATDDMSYSYSDAEGIDWSAEEDGKPIAQLIVEDAKQAAQLYRIIETEIAKAGITLTEDDNALLQAQFAQTISQYGEEEYARLLQQMAISDAGLRHLMEVSYLYTPLQEYYYGEKGKNPATAETIIAMAEEQGLMLAKHILIKTVDDSGNELPEEEQAAAKAKAEDLLSQLETAAAQSTDALHKLFDQLMEENSEDGRDAEGKLSAPEGYLFGAGQMVQEFEDGTRALEYNQMSGLVKTTYGYHIILRLSPDNEEMRTQWAATKMREDTDNWMMSAQVVDTDEMAKVDIQDFYEKLVTYRASLEPAPETTTTPTPSPEG